MTTGRGAFGSGGRGGWPGILSARTAAPCTLTNLAADGASVSRGARAAAARARADRASPDLVSVTVGMNDIRDPGFSDERFAAGLGTLLDGLTVTGATVLTCTLPDIAGIMPLPAHLVDLARQRMRRPATSSGSRHRAAARSASTAGPCPARPTRTCSARTGFTPTPAATS